MRARCLACLLILSLVGLPAFADPPPPTTQKSDGDAKKHHKKKKNRSSKKKSQSKAARDRKTGDASANAADGKADTDADTKSPPKRNLAAKGLKMVIEDATFEEMTFEDFTEWLGRTTGANVVVRWAILEKGGVDRAFPIYVKQKNIHVRKILELVFSQVTRELNSIEIAAKADGNTLIISSRKDINTQRVTRVYEAQHLLLIVPDFGGPPAPDPGGGTGGSGGARGGTDGGGQITKTDKGGGSGGGGRSDGGRGRGGRRSGGPATGGPTSERQPDVDAETQRIIDYITSTIQPMSWKVNGGKGTIRYYKGKLVVYNNLEVHQALEQMLPKAGE